MSKRQSELDYAVIAINPALIMLLVGSLVFFLLEIVYRGPYPGRLQFILGDFVFASVLLARLTIEEGFEKSGRLGAFLAFAMLLALWRFVPDSVLLGLCMLLLIWWCANRLTYDCTLVDESRDTSQKGLMQWIGADFDFESAPAASPAVQTAPEPITADSDAEAAQKRTWLWDFLDPTSTRFAPGVWVIYFSLAALPLFGLGQAFEPSGDPSLRWRLFLYLFTYVAAGLGLLMTTSFLSLRRYLGKRNLPMPLSMAGVWLGTGAVLIAVVLIFTALLPRPHAEYEVARIPGVGDLLKRASSRFAIGSEGTQDDKQQGQTESNDRQQAGEKQTAAGDGVQGAKSQDQKKSGDGDKTSSSGKNSDQGKGQSGDDKQQKQDQSGKQKNDSDDKSQPNQSQSNDTQQKSDPGKSPEKSQSNSDQSDGDQSKRDDSANANRSDEQKSQDNNAKPPGEKSESTQNSPPPPKPSSSPSPPLSLSGLLGSIAQFFKLLIYALVAIVAIYFAWKYREQIAGSWAKFVQELKDFWNRLFGQSEPVMAAVEAVPAARQPRFPAFANPFAPGARPQSSEQLIRYTFQALEAWGADQGFPRNSDQTAEEYARLLAHQVDELGPPARELASHYAEIAYGSGRAPESAIQCAKRVWRVLR